MKKKSAKQLYLETLSREVEEVITGTVAAARVAEVALNTDALVISRREIDPEISRAEAARKFAVRSDVARLRHRLNLSQQAFARRLRIPLATVQKWERNATKPTGAAATLLDLLDRKPELIEALGD